MWKSSDIIEIQLAYKDSKSDKFYNMKRDSTTAKKFIVEYGRSGAKNPRTIEYDIWDWNKKLDEKLKKGYKVVFEGRENDMDTYPIIDDPSENLIIDGSEDYIDEYGGDGDSVVVVAKNGTKVRVKELSEHEKNGFLQKIEVLKEKIKNKENEKTNQYIADVDFIEKYLNSKNFVTKKSLARLVEISKSI